jgi:beta-galactosidase/beta-glucuronidase
LIKESEMSTIPRPEHPRPDFERDSFYNLNGTWQFAFDDDDRGLQEGWEQPGKTLEREILVPFCYQSAMSGIGGDEIHPILWYRRAFDLPEDMRGRTVWLRFGAVDFESRVYLNGHMVGSHTGGYTPFGFDITPWLQQENNDLCVRVVDRPDLRQPRGKQYWQRGLMGCWYTPCSGIWQTVYLEATGHNALADIRLTPDITHGLAHLEVELARTPRAPLTLEYELALDERVVQSGSWQSHTCRAGLCLDMKRNGPGGLRLWHPRDPALYQLRLTLLEDGEALDRVTTWFGMREVRVENGQVLLNNEPLYQRLVLDQGYWPDSLLTPPDDEAIRADVRWIRDLGFNGARKHQKIEDPRFYHWCDRLGVLVWGELPACYEFDSTMLQNTAQAMLDFIRRDYNHPCIIAWVPLNESWGVREICGNKRQQAAARMLTQLCRAADGTRLISANDGWEQTETDICALHDYAAEGGVLEKHFDSRARVEAGGNDRKMAYARGVRPTGKEAFLVTEYGGIAMQTKGEQGEMGGMATWGYHDKVKDEEAFLARYSELTDAIRAIPYCEGYCYTQLTDVMQEINGLLDPRRVPKADPARIRDINRNPKGR